MITRIYLICIALLISCLSVGEGFASMTKTYTPAPQISLTGTTSDVRFDVAAPLFGSPFSGAYLDTNTQNMSGAFYIRDIGWALMSSGAYQVKIDCGIALKDILPTTPQCQFTGSGWAENIWELSFANVRYNPSTGKLSGLIGSFVGDVSVYGISLPLRPVDLIESLTGLTADHATILTVQSGSEYGDGTWDLEIIPSKNSSYSKSFDWGAVGIFPTDLSLADRYTWEIKDPQKSITKFEFVEVKPNLLSQNFDLTPGFFIEEFCTNTPTEPICIGRWATELIRTAPATAIADGASYYNFTLKPRDKYGNRVDTGTVEISYTGSILNIQLPSDIFSTLYIPGIFDPIVFQSTWFSFIDKKVTVVIDGTDISYGIASIAPTDASNTLVLDEIKYTSPTGVVSIFSDTEAVTFAKPYTADIDPPTALLLGTSNHFVGALHKLTLESLSPELITTLLIGDGLFANMSDLTSDPAWVGKENDTDWIVGSSNPSSISIPTPTPTFWFTGTYSPYTAYPELEKLSYQSLIHYQIGGIDVIYPVDSGDQDSQYKASRIKILGQNNARAEYGTISTTKKSRSDVFNKIRKTVALLSRGRTSYTDVPYTIATSDQSIDNDYFINDKQTIIVVGKDITITENIDRDSDHPLAIIALAKDGVGGNIIIADTVTDIHASLFAEHAVLSSGDSQLYIGGSLVSGNTLGETAAGICPYYVTGTCDAEEYDLEELRSYTGSTSPSASPRASEYPGTALIIEYDMRLQTDPPPGLSQ